MVENSKGEIFPDKTLKKNNKCIALGLCILISVGFSIYTLKMINNMVVSEMLVRDIIFCSVMLLSAELFLIILTLVYYDREWAKYQIEYNGLKVKYPFQVEKIILWNELQQVCICYGEVKTKPEYWAYVYICFVKKGQRKTSSGRWRHGTFSYRGVIPMDYTEELYKEVKEKCPLGIVDLRDTPEYSLDRSVRAQSKMFK